MTSGRRRSLTVGLVAVVATLAIAVNPYACADDPPPPPAPTVEPLRRPTADDEAWCVAPGDEPIDCEQFRHLTPQAVPGLARD